MLQRLENATVEEASNDLLPFILQPQNWVMVDGADDVYEGRVIDYCRNVDSLRIRASVDLSPELGVCLHVAFRAPGLTPLKAAEHLEEFLTPRFPLVPNTEWQVEVDGRRWVHFRRKYIQEVLKA
jgi:hypothetical protein